MPDTPDADAARASTIVTDAVRACEHDDDYFVMACPPTVQSRIVTALRSARAEGAKTERGTLVRALGCGVCDESPSLLLHLLRLEKGEALIVCGDCRSPELPAWRFVVEDTAYRARGQQEAGT